MAEATLATFRRATPAGSTPQIAVVGAGVAGLSAAIDLAHTGAQVTVLEGAATPGGKMRTIEVAGRDVDSGPTVLTMRWVFDELFEAVGVASPVAFVPAEVLARHAWMDGSRLDLFADVEASVAAIAAFAGRAEGDAYRNFARHTERIYRTVEGPFLRAQRPSFFGLVRDAVRGAASVTGLAQIDGMTTLWKTLAGTFHDPRLRQLFGRYATYAGSSPFEAPGTLALIAHVEREGVHYVQGGMSALARGLEQVAKGLGVTFHYGERVRAIEASGSKVSGVVTDARHLRVDAVVFAGDLATLASGALGDVGVRAAGGYAFPVAKRSLSALTYSMVAQASGFPLARHNVFFSRDYAAEFRDLFQRGRLPEEPTVYVCAQDRDDTREPGPGEAERLFMIVNAPATGSATEVDRCEAAMNRVLETSGLSLRIEDRRRTTPADFEKLFPGTGGALYGLSSHGPMSAFRRPSARTPLGGFYVASGSAHPGAGVPMAALSGRLAACALREDFASTARFRTTATAGSISIA